MQYEPLIQFKVWSFLGGSEVCSSVSEDKPRFGRFEVWFSLGLGSLMFSIFRFIPSLNDTIQYMWENQTILHLSEINKSHDIHCNTRIPATYLLACTFSSENKCPDLSYGAIENRKIVVGSFWFAFL